MTLSPEILERTKTLVENGATISELADIFDTTYVAIRGRLAKLGIKPARKAHIRPNDDFLSQRNQIICEAYQAGQTLEAVGKAHRMTRERVRQILEMHGVERRHEWSTKPKRPRLTEEQKGLRLKARFWTKIDITTDPQECWVWKRPYSTAYPRGRYRTDEGKDKSEYAHRVAYILTYGQPKNWVLHRCSNPACCNPNHLYDGTPADNARDRDLAGNGPLDNPNYKRRLSPDKIPVIESLIEMGIPQIKIAKHFDVSMNRVNRISRQMKAQEQL